MALHNMSFLILRYLVSDYFVATVRTISKCILFTALSRFTDVKLTSIFRASWVYEPSALR
jgi:hypothetical protein